MHLLLHRDVSDIRNVSAISETAVLIWSLCTRFPGVKFCLWDQFKFFPNKSQGPRWKPHQQQSCEDIYNVFHHSPCPKLSTPASFIHTIHVNKPMGDPSWEALASQSGPQTQTLIFGGWIVDISCTPHTVPSH